MIEEIAAISTNLLIPKLKTELITSILAKAESNIPVLILYFFF